VRIERSIQQMDPAAWDVLVREQGLYFQRRYLRGVELGAQQGVEHRYALFLRDGESRGVACFQIVQFVGPSIDPMLRGSAATRLVARALGVDGGPLVLVVIVCGSTFNCGETGFTFAPQVEAPEALASLKEALRQIQQERSQSQRVTGVLFKEFGPTSGPLAGMLPQQGYRQLVTGPKLVLEVDPAWGGFEGYLGSLKSKFRVKAKRAYKKSAALQVRSLDLDDLRRQQARIARLHAGVADRATYRLGKIEIASLLELRSRLGSELVFQGYYLGDALVGFMTGFQVGDSLDAHAVGFDYRLNRAHSIYPRMLYDYLRIAIERGLAQVDFGRTAEEIKSSLGAVPVPTHCYLRHRSQLVNPLLGVVTRAIKPADFPLRQPFKAQPALERKVA